jgi:hypothetical protein
MPKETWASLGLSAIEVTPQIEDLMGLYITLDRAWRRPFSIKSTFARTGAFHVGVASSEGLITTNVEEDVWGVKWKITEIGRETKEALDELLQEIFANAHGRNHPSH